MMRFVLKCNYYLYIFLFIYVLNLSKLKTRSSFIQYAYITTSNPILPRTLVHTMPAVNFFQNLEKDAKGTISILCCFSGSQLCMESIVTSFVLFLNGSLQMFFTQFEFCFNSSNLFILFTFLIGKIVAIRNCCIF